MPNTPSSFRTIEVGEQACPRGVLKSVTVKSTNLKGRADCSVYVPQQVTSDETVPVVILLHGVYGSHWAWNLKGKAHETLQALIDNGDIPPMILATPSDGLWGDGSSYTEHGGKSFEKWIIEDVPQLVHEATGNARNAPLYIGGLSMGGYGALRLGAKYPEIFQAFAGHSSITAFDELGQFIEESLSDYNEIKTSPLSVFETIQQAGGKLRPFRFDCGTEDQLIEGNRTLHKQLTEAGIEHTYEEFPGGHEWPYWETHVAKTLKFFAKA